MELLRETIRRVALSDRPVLVTGPTGTGKELVVSAIPENLAESELFGHEKGAFTGADATRTGFFGEADGGTLFLDEIGLLAPTLQAKLLRVLQDGDYIPVGSRKAKKANVRVVCATNENLRKNVDEGKFREDLYFRIRVIPLRLAPLRERREDIPLLVAHLVKKHAVRLGRPPLQPDPIAMKALLDFAWPGNVRELEHALERALLLARGEVIALGDLPPELARPAHEPGHEGEHGEGDYRHARDAWERRYFQELLEEAQGSVSRAAELAGIHRSTLYEKLARMGLVSGEDAKKPHGNGHGPPRHG